MLRQHNSSAEQRRGVILMVVLALLTLFAIVGITFVFYAQKSHSASVNFRAAWQLPNQNGAGSGGGGGPPDIDAGVLLKFGLGQLIYDADDTTGVESALRGHSLARNLYGYNDQALNVQPFNGTGRLHYASTSPVVTGQDDYSLINYTYFPTDGFLRDPEHSGQRAGPTTPRTQQAQPFIGSANPPYSYPDPNFMALAAARANGTNLINSFYRPWIFGPLAASNPNWQLTSPQGKYMIQRPRPADMGPGFPYPADTTGDVKNKIGALGGNDSLWMDMGYPVTAAADGSLFKPLFAWRVEDLDGKINYNTAGNLRGNNGTITTHASHEGWGKWEVSLAQLFNAPAAPLEWRNIFLAPPTSTVRGRYGLDGQPGKTGSSASSGKSPRFFEQVDYDGSNEQASGAPTPRLVLPAGLSPFPTFPQGYGNGSATERLNHPMLYDYFYPNNLGSDDGALLVSDVEYLLYGGAGAATNPEVLQAQVAQLCPQNFKNNPRLQGLITPLSVDLDRMGLSPWLFARQTSTYGYLPTGSNPLVQAPSSPPVPFPGPSSTPPIPFGTTPPTNSDFSKNWRAVFATLEKIDLRQNPPSYPHQSGALPSYFSRFDTAANWLTSPIGQQFTAAQAYRQTLADQIYRRLLIVTNPPQPANLATPALTDPALPVLRWLGQLAVNIVDFIDEDEISTPFNYYATAYNFFAVLNGLPPPQQTPPATIYSASSGTNTVNQDPAITPRPATETVLSYWVFGTELPAVVLNEVNTEYVIPPPAMPVQPAQFPVQVWAELYCPFPVPLTPVPPGPNNPVQIQDNQNTTPIPLYVAPSYTGSAPYSTYKVTLADVNPSTTPPANSPLYMPVPDTTGNAAGTPNFVRNETLFNTNATTPLVGGGAPVPTAIKSGTYFLVGPGPDTPNTIASPRVPAATPFYQSATMSYNVVNSITNVWKLGSIGQTGKPTIQDKTAGITVLLRRLANPHLPPNPQPTLANGSPNPLYNPYVTVDYLSPIPLNNGSGITNANPIYSYGKLQPYASDNTAGTGTPNSQVQRNTNAAVNGQTPVQHTFGLPNNPNITNVTPAPPTGNAASWLVHLDRQPNNPIELLQVSGFRPWQLTQMFIVNRNPFQHLVQWFDQDIPVTNPPRSHLLYRLFGFLETSDRAAGVSRYGRVPGRVNINTIWDPEVLMALLDPPPTSNPAASNYFTVADVQTLWGNLLRTRTPGIPPALNNGGSISGSDRPFLDMAAAFLPPPSIDPQARTRYGSIQDTMFRAVDPTGNPLGPRLFRPATPASNHPAIKWEMLTKLYNNVTNRSNTFAVWLTVGFFKVTDPTTTPPKLGAEIGASTGTNIRHRFFCVVDRSQVVISGLNGYLAKSVSIPQGGAVMLTDLGKPKQIFLNPKRFLGDPVNSIHGTIGYYNGGTAPWQFQAGSQVVVDRGLPTEEVVVLQNFTVPPYPAANPGNPPDLGTYGTPGQTAPSIAAIFNRPHQPGFTLDIYGNPGPQTAFDYSLPAYIPVVPVVRIVQ